MTTEERIGDLERKVALLGGLVIQLARRLGLKVPDQEPKQQPPVPPKPGKYAGVQQWWMDPAHEKELEQVQRDFERMDTSAPLGTIYTSDGQPVPVKRRGRAMWLG